jgi:hypothetical protein
LLCISNSIYRNFFHREVIAELLKSCPLKLNRILIFFGYSYARGKNNAMENIDNSCISFIDCLETSRTGICKGKTFSFYQDLKVHLFDRKSDYFN